MNVELLEEEDNLEKNSNQKSTKEKIEKSEKKIILKKRMRILIICLVSILLLIFGIFFIYRYFQNLNRITFEKHDLYQYFSGVKYEYKGNITIERGNKITSIKSKNLNINAESIPIYFKNIDNKVIFPSEMGLIFPNIRNKNYKVRYFSEIFSDVSESGESTFIKIDDKDIYLSNSIFYDGDNLYFFPYSTKVIIQGKEFNLSALSYIIVNYKGEIEIYNKKEDKYEIIEEHDEDVIAYVDNYKINLSTDMIIYDSENRLFIKNISKLDYYKKK